jgi:hypothetical protein
MRVLAVLALLMALFSARAADTPPLYALLVGGGPDQENNAAQIEGHVHFVGSIFPPGTRRTVLFADGKTDGAKVCFLDKSADATARQALGVLLPKDDALNAPDLRPLQLGLPVDGSAGAKNIHVAIGKLAAEATARPAPVLLYFAGHGSASSDAGTPAYDMWDDKELDVHALAREVARLPASAHVTLVMAQCYSGAFGDVLFTGGTEKGLLARTNFVGFFSAAPDREASGCSWETGEADYQDFSSYFFGALTGRDRFGHAVTGADFDGDGRVTLHEAFCYALEHDVSIDTPVCTSEVFLRRAVQLDDDKIFGAPYAQVAAEATPAQRAVLEALSQRLGLTGDDRALTVFDKLEFADQVARNSELDTQNTTGEQLDALRLGTLETLFKDWPDLRWNDSAKYDDAVKGAQKSLAQNPALCRSLLDTAHTSDLANGVVDNEEADLMRFRMLYAAIVRAAELRAHGTKADRAHFESIWQAEQATLPLVAVPER